MMPIALIRPFLTAAGLRKAVLRREPPAGTGTEAGTERATEPTPAERAVLTVTGHSAKRVENRHRRSLERAVQAVLRSTRAAERARLEKALTSSDPTRALRRKDAEETEAERLRRRPDLVPAALSVWFVLGLEFGVPLVEFFWWRQTWSREIDERLPWNSPEKFGVLLLALVIPILSVCLAHIAGALLNRVVRHPEAAHRADRIGAAVSLALVAVATGVMFVLVRWRYTDGAGLGALSVPPTSMALVFVMLLLIIVAARTFGTSVAADQARVRATVVQRERKQDADQAGRILSADEQQSRDWFGAVTVIDRCLSQIDGTFATGSVILLDHWALAGARPADLHPRSNAEVLAGPAAEVEPVGYQVPSGRPQLWLSPAWSQPIELRHLEHAIGILAAHLPQGRSDAASNVERLREELQRLSEARPNDPVPTPATPPAGAPDLAEITEIATEGVRTGDVDTGNVQSIDLRSLAREPSEAGPAEAAPTDLAV